MGFQPLVLRISEKTEVQPLQTVQSVWLSRSEGKRPEKMMFSAPERDRITNYPANLIPTNTAM